MAHFLYFKIELAFTTYADCEDWMRLTLLKQLLDSWQSNCYISVAIIIIPEPASANATPSKAINQGRKLGISLQFSFHFTPHPTNTMSHHPQDCCTSEP